MDVYRYSSDLGKYTIGSAGDVSYGEKYEIGEGRMSISTKNKRKLVYENKTYYWHVSPDYDRGELRKNFNILHIIADDKSLEYHIPLECLNPVPESITPSFVKNILEKALNF